MERDLFLGPQTADVSCPRLECLNTYSYNKRGLIHTGRSVFQKQRLFKTISQGLYGEFEEILVERVEGRMLKRRSKMGLLPVGEELI